jgi:hypothetical protein
MFCRGLRIHRERFQARLHDLLPNASFHRILFYELFDSDDAFVVTGVSPPTGHRATELRYILIGRAPRESANAC